MDANATLQLVMATPALVFAVVAALGWAGLDAFRKSLAADVGASPLVLLFSAAQLPFFAAWMWIEGGSLDVAAYWVPGLVGIVLNIGANLWFVRAMQVSPLSVTIPFLAFTPAFAALLAIPTLGELPGPWQGLGIAFVMAGALLITSSKEESLWAAVWKEPGVIMMIGVAAQWAATISIDKLATQHAPLSVHATVQVTGVALGALFATIVSGQLHELTILRRRPFAILGTAVVGCLALGLQLAAIQTMMVGVVETLKRAVGMASAVVVGRILFDEAITGRKVVAIAIMTAGAGAIMLL